MKQRSRATFGCALGMALVLGVAACSPTGEPDGPIVGPADPSSATSEPAPEPPSESADPEPSSESPSSSEPDGTPLPVEEDWDREDSAWGGFPPPVLFQPVFASGEWPGFPKTFEGHELENEADFGNSFRGEYMDTEGRPSYAFEVLANPLAYESQVKLWQQPQQVGFALCDAAQQEHPDCMMVSNDAVFNLSWTGEAGAITMEETADRLADMMVALSEG